MKKSLVALAVAAALPAFAQAQTSVTLTGSVDGALEWVSKEVTGQKSDLRVTNGVWSGSRFAIVGSEDLGGGLKGLFNIEHRLNVDDGKLTSNTFWHGQSWVGLGGGFGTIRLGRQYTPIFYALQPADVTGYSWYNNLVGLGGTAIRFNNYASYQSNSLGGFTLRAGYAAGEGYDPSTTAGTPAAGYDSKLGDTFGVSLNGAFGGFSVGLGYHGVDGGAAGTDRDEYALALGGKFGAVGFGLGYAVSDFDSGAETTGLGVSASVGFGAGTIYLAAKRTEAETAAGAKTKTDALGLTYNHGLSKRTFVYTSFGYANIKPPAGSSTKPKTAAIGIRHFF